MSVVIDASVVVALLVGSCDAVVVEALAGHELHAPSVLPYEVTQALRRVSLSGLVDAGLAQSAARDLLTMPIITTPFDELAARIWELRSNVTVYDAAYIALAESLDLPLLTLDRRLARASGVRCEVVVPR